MYCLRILDCRHVSFGVEVSRKNNPPLGFGDVDLKHPIVFELPFWWSRHVALRLLESFLTMQCCLPATFLGLILRWLDEVSRRPTSAFILGYPIIGWVTRSRRHYGMPGWWLWKWLSGDMPHLISFHYILRRLDYIVYKTQWWHLYICCIYTLAIFLILLLICDYFMPFFPLSPQSQPV